jgi:hypothetical protein
MSAPAGVRSVDGMDDVSGMRGVDEPVGRSFGDWVWWAFLAVLVLAVSFFATAVVSLFAISCSTCQDGVRDLRFPGLLGFVAWYMVPATALGTAIGLLVPRGGAKAGWIGAGLLATLFVAILIIGHIPA